MKKLAAILKTADGVLTSVLKWITITLFTLLIVIITLNILLRYFPITSFHWMDEIVELCFGALVFYGSAAVWMTQGHFSVGDWISKRIKSEKGKLAYRLVLEIICLIFAVILLKYSFALTTRTMEVTAVFQIPKRVLYSCMPISALIMVVYSFARCILGLANIAGAKKGKVIADETWLPMSLAFKSYRTSRPVTFLFSRTYIRPHP